MNHKFVFDTNAFISASLISGSVNELALNKAFQTGRVIVSTEGFAEFTEVDERSLQIY